MTEAALLAAIRESPDDDMLRLVYADWLDDQGDAARAEFVRVQCELEPIRQQEETERSGVLRARERELFAEHRQRWIGGLAELLGRKGVGYEFRRGFLHEVALPAKWLIEHGASLREQYPLLRRVALFRFNGWGERIAHSPHIKGLPELEIACWADSDDFRALARSPRLKKLEVLQIWDSDRYVAELLGGSSAWPRLRELRLLNLDGTRWAWEWAVNGAARREIGVHDNFYERPYRLDDGFCMSLFVGHLPDNRGVFANAFGGYTDPIQVLIYDPAGRVAEQRELPVPASLADKDYSYRLHHRERIKEYLHEALGFRAGSIRVREVRFAGQDRPYSSRLSARLAPLHGQHDIPHEDGGWADGDPGGIGSRFYEWVKNDCFAFSHGNEECCDRNALSARKPSQCRFV